MMRVDPRKTSSLPPSLRGAEVGSFAHSTVARRLPEIAQRTLRHNDFPPDVIEQMEALIESLPHGAVRPLLDSDAPDAEAWERYLAPHQGESWLEVPWFFAETYFYRRILEATGYFQEGPGRGVDPFAFEKRRGLQASRVATAALSADLGQRRWDPDVFIRLLRQALWGNQADLSLWPGGKGGEGADPEAQERKAHTLVDDSRRVESVLPDSEAPVDVLADNAGFELVSDLALADFLLTSGRVARVRFHLKAHPVFVSDAMGEDVHDTVRALTRESDAGTRALGERVQAHLASGRLALQEPWFPTSPLPFWKMPDALREDLAHAALVISKGDANYRRLLGDRHWPFTTPFESIVRYFPAPVLALRTLKSEVAAGLDEATIERANGEDPDWLTDGEWGLIQLALVD